MTREFRLSPAGSGHGVSCDEAGAFIDSIPLLKRTRLNGETVWVARNAAEISDALSSNYGLPIDFSSRAGGLNAIARALNEGELARAQTATVLLAIPEAPVLSKSASARHGLIRFIRDLHQSNLIKADWDADEHPRWPAGAPDSQGGQFAPKGEGGDLQGTSGDSITARDTSSAFLQYGDEEAKLDDGVYHPDSDPAELDPTASSPAQLLLNRLQHDRQVLREMESYRRRGVPVIPNVTFEDPRTGTRIIADYVVSIWVPDPESMMLPTLEPMLVRDVKTGDGGLTDNQKQVYPYILRGGEVIPVGFNAALAGFHVGEPTNIAPIFNVGRDAPSDTEH